MASDMFKKMCLVGVLFFVLVFFTAFVLAGCGVEPEPDVEEEAVDEEKIEDEKTDMELAQFTWDEQGCASCHGENNEGTEMAPALDEPILSHGDNEHMAEKIRGGYNNMPAFSEDELSDDKMYLILDWLREKEGVPEPDGQGH